MAIKMDTATSLLVDEAVEAQLEDAYGGGGRTLSINFAHSTLDAGILVELVVEALVAWAQGLNIYICLFDKDGQLVGSIREPL